MALKGAATEGSSYKKAVKVLRILGVIIQVLFVIVLNAAPSAIGRCNGNVKNAKNNFLITQNENLLEFSLKMTNVFRVALKLLNFY